MKKLSNRFTLALGVIFVSLFFFSSTIAQDQKKGGPWDIPTEYQAMENSFAGDASTLKFGKMLYSKHCKSCHGNYGKGDGPKAKDLETFAGDFTLDEFDTRSDGVLYYQSFIGRDEMPNYEKKITDEEDRWSVINYINTLADK